MHIRFCLVLLAAVLSASAGEFAAAAFVYSTIDNPLAGAGGTVPYDLDGNRIVGTYFDKAGTSHAFVYDGVTWTPLDHPNAAAPRGTAAYGVSDGVLCGSFVDSTGRTFGYTYDGTTWTTLAHPPLATGPVDTFARGIDGDTVVGYFIESQVARGFVYRNGTFTDLIIPPAVGTFPNDVNAGRIVGTIEDVLGSHAFLKDGALVIPIDHPLGAILGTFGNGIDGERVVGNYLDLLDGASHGFLYEDGTFTPIDYPGATDTIVNGINGDRVVGSYVDAAGVTHGFLATVPEPAAGAAMVASAGLLTLRRARRTTRPE
jgi:hypothetical protein